jgi:aspartate-semialdehyde dehydrogenase
MGLGPGGETAYTSLVSAKIKVAVLGATGSVGQKFVTLVTEHPWFELVALTASDRSAGKRYGESVRWVQSSPLAELAAGMDLLRSEPTFEAQLVFSALDADVAGEIESAFAARGALVVSNAKSHRMDADVPLVVPEVNPEHLALARSSRYRPGAIVTNPNCSTIGLTMALKPLWDRFGVRRVFVVTMQAVSGAGLPGVASYEILDNVIPFISGEEEKMERESRKILGRFSDGEVREADISISAQCNRVPVLDGHMLSVSVALETKATLEDVRKAWTSFTAEPQSRNLPTAPRNPIHYLASESSPQPRLHRDLERGMAVAVGRLRPCTLLDFKFTALSHNTMRGAAGGALLLGELLAARTGLGPCG